MAQTTDLMTIGQFSSLSRLSVRMLRHYDAHGVLVPADVDPGTGYRRYCAEQLALAADIRTLRDVGLGVGAISALLATRGTDAWTHALRLQREVLAEELHAAQGRLTLIDRLLAPGDPMSITIERVIMPAATVAALRGTVPTYADEPRLWQRMMPLLAAQGIEAVGPCGVVEHDDEYTEHDVDLSVVVPVAPGTRVQAPLAVHDLPARDCLVARVAGPYEQISAAHDLLAEQLTAQGLTVRQGDGIADKAFNRYLVTPDQAAPEDLVTEVCLPLS